MDEKKRERICAEAERIKRELEGGMLYGEWIDPEDDAMMIVAAYYHCGLTELIKKIQAK